MDQESGAQLWATDLKGAGFVTLLMDGNHVFAATHGEIYCLNAADGRILWHDPLKGYGFGLVSIATKNGSSNSAALAGEKKRQDDDSAAAGAAVAAS